MSDYVGNKQNTEQGECLLHHINIFSVYPHFLKGFEGANTWQVVRKQSKRATTDYMAGLATHNLIHISVCSVNTIRLMTRLRKGLGLHSQNSLTAPIYKVTANSKALIMIKQEETGLEEERLVGRGKPSHQLERGTACRQKRNPADTLDEYL